MASFSITSYVDIGTIGYPTAGTWEVATDPEFVNVIDRTIADEKYVLHWVSPLPKLDGTGYHADLDAIYVRVKLHVHDDVSDWFYLEPKNQNDQTYNVIRDGVVIKTLDSLLDNIN